MRNVFRQALSFVGAREKWEYQPARRQAGGLLRQYFPKAMGLLDVTTRQVLEAVHKLNNKRIYFKIHGKFKCHQNVLTADQKI